jgi:flagellar biosynthesis GTPase FlhF
VFILNPGYFWYFWLTIQNTTNRHVSNAFDLLAVFISFSGGTESLAVRPRIAWFLVKYFLKKEKKKKKTEKKEKKRKRKKQKEKRKRKKEKRKEKKKEEKKKRKKEKEKKKKKKQKETKTKERKGEFRAGLYPPGIESRNTTPHAINGLVEVKKASFPPSSTTP